MTSYQNKFPLDLQLLTRFFYGEWQPKYHYGVTAHRGVLVFFDGDRDNRILRLIDDMNREDRRQLVAVHEHEGCLMMVWNSHIPYLYSISEGSNGVDVEGDYWTIQESALYSNLADHIRKDRPYDSKSVNFSITRTREFTELSDKEQDTMLGKVHSSLVTVLEEHNVAGSTAKYSLYRELQEMFERVGAVAKV